ncbi:hypothetical protein AB6805_30520 [Chitinophaga sp. RCC_12]
MQDQLGRIYDEIDYCDNEHDMVELLATRDELKEEIELVKEELYSMSNNY